jgi:hypothetical protein
LWLVAVVLAGTGGVLLGQTVWPPPNWEPSLTQAHAQLLVTVREELQQSRAQAHTLRLARIREELQRSDQRLRETISLLETLNVTITRLRIILSDLLNGAYGPVKKKDPDKKDKEVDTEVKKKALVLNHCITVLSKVHLDLCERGGKSPWDVAGVADAKDQLMKASDPALEKVIEPEVLAAIKAGDPNSFRRIQEHDETLKTLPALVARLEQRYQPGEICAEGLANLLDKRKPLLAELADLERHLTEANSR